VRGEEGVSIALGGRCVGNGLSVECGSLSGWSSTLCHVAGTLSAAITETRVFAPGSELFFVRAETSAARVVCFSGVGERINDLDVNGDRGDNVSPRSPGLLG